MTQDWAKLAADLERLLKLRAIPFGMKLFETRVEMEAIPRIRQPKSVHTLDQVVAQAARLGWTVGITSHDLVGAQCRAVVGLGRAKDEKWRSGEHMAGVWYSAPEDARSHQAAMECVPDGRYEALAVAPLASGRLDPPDIALFYATPGAMIYFINGLQWAGYKRFDWSVVGESACADSWGRALKTRQPSLSIPCFAERRYGGVLDDEMLMALPPDDIPKAIAGMRRLQKTACATPFRNTASNRTSAPAWRSATLAEAAKATLLPLRFRQRPPLGECLGPWWRIGLALFATCASSGAVLLGK